MSVYLHHRCLTSARGCPSLTGTGHIAGGGTGGDAGGRPARNAGCAVSYVGGVRGHVLRGGCPGRTARTGCPGKRLTRMADSADRYLASGWAGRKRASSGPATQRGGRHESTAVDSTCEGQVGEGGGGRWGRDMKGGLREGRSRDY